MRRSCRPFCHSLVERYVPLIEFACWPRAPTSSTGATTVAEVKDATARPRARAAWGHAKPAAQHASRGPSCSLLRYETTLKTLASGMRAKNMRFRFKKGVVLLVVVVLVAVAVDGGGGGGRSWRGERALCDGKSVDGGDVAPAAALPIASPSLAPDIPKKTPGLCAGTKARLELASVFRSQEMPHPLHWVAVILSK